MATASATAGARIVREDQRPREEAEAEREEALDGHADEQRRDAGLVDQAAEQGAGRDRPEPAVSARRAAAPVRRWARNARSVTKPPASSVTVLAETTISWIASGS